MPSGSWVYEELHPGWGQRFRMARELAHSKSLHQDIVIFENETFGRVLMLDGVVQITEKDEFAYQEMLVHVPLVAHGDAKRVLIIGGGDGGVLRRVLQHATVQRAVMVEIDAEVMRLAREFLPEIGGDAWVDPRAEVIVGDGIAYLAAAAEAAFDVIVVDSTDPIGVGEVLFTEAFYAHAARVLTPDGVIVNQCGVPFLQGQELTASNRLRRKFFPEATAYLVAVPSYVGGFMTLGWGAKAPSLTELPDAELKRRAEAAGILGTTRYWTPEVHAAAFRLPPYIAKLLAA